MSTQYIAQPIMADLQLETVFHRDPKSLEAREVMFLRDNAAMLAREHGGKFLLIHGNEVAGAFDTTKDLYVEAMRREWRHFVYGKVYSIEEHES